MDRKLIILMVLVAFSMVACMTPEIDKSVRYDFNVNTDFNDIKTFNWHPTSSTLNMEHLTLERIKSAVKIGMTAKGFSAAKDSPDFLIVAYGGPEKVYTTKWLGDWSNDLYYERGRLHLSFVDPKSNQPIWWGETDAELKSYMTPDEKNEIIDDAIQRILSKFPPTS